MLSAGAAQLFAEGPDVPAALAREAARKDFWTARRGKPAAAASAASAAGVSSTAAASATAAAAAAVMSCSRASPPARAAALLPLAGLRASRRKSDAALPRARSIGGRGAAAGGLKEFAVRR